MTQIIPAIDIIDGKCVRLTRGDYDCSKTYSANPLDVARRFQDAGCQRLHLVDLDGARSHHIINYKTLEAIANGTDMIIDFGGGIKSNDDIRIAFECGAAMVTGGSIAVNDPALFKEWLSTYGADKIILGADARNGKISVNGWHEDSELDVTGFISDYHALGIHQVISTDISVDGTLTGPSVDMYKRILDITPDIYLIASGGVGSMNDIDQLTQADIPAVIVGKAIYEGKIKMADIEHYNLLNT
ncbi:MAG: 1-(5-phosphoribosyl)-5-[(5-phosphoribosylamino)methylideneamino]imidazole-4-carboxamide isomerase [Muribaculaceae bacterium]|nr:1-(5-phosphoribosyl)-5-[(5-phosphoribosylamino)methylideneamino]imidazole-4-carboxamide isomerase [Muribaculaceae bacterium]